MGRAINDQRKPFACPVADAVLGAVTGEPGNVEVALLQQRQVVAASPVGPAFGELLGRDEPVDIERARIGRSGVGLSRVVSDLLEREGFEFGAEFT